MLQAQDVLLYLGKNTQRDSGLAYCLQVHVWQTSLQAGRVAFYVSVCRPGSDLVCLVQVQQQASSATAVVVSNQQLRWLLQQVSAHAAARQQNEQTLQVQASGLRSLRAQLAAAKATIGTLEEQVGT